jgi:hypothetical protein
MMEPTGQPGAPDPTVGKPVTEQAFRALTPLLALAWVLSGATMFAYLLSIRRRRPSRADQPSSS